MTIYVDPPVHWGKSGVWCHMWHDTDDREALDAFALRIGLKKEWAQLGGGGRFYHYDLRPRFHKKALRAGAIEITLQAWLRSKKFQT